MLMVRLSLSSEAPPWPGPGGASQCQSHRSHGAPLIPPVPTDTGYMGYWGSTRTRILRVRAQCPTHCGASMHRSVGNTSILDVCSYETTVTGDQLKAPGGVPGSVSQHTQARGALWNTLRHLQGQVNTQPGGPGKTVPQSTNTDQ